MGTSGDRKGYKIFSINTTIRNPKRNYDFLDALKTLDGQMMNKVNLEKYLFILVKKGIYKFEILSQNVKQKLENGVELTQSEVEQVISDNPQATGLVGRVMTQLRGLKDLSLISFEGGSKRNEQVVYISKLGKELLQNPGNATNIYTKIMLGIQANNPCREKLLNKSRPFLNTLFVINEVNKLWKELGNEPKGILKHEFAVFVLSMKDCNYKLAAGEIIKYRKIYKSEINKKYLLEYLEHNDILPLNWNSIINDYPDEVYRKFEMTGLLIKHGKFNYTYINFSEYNKSKIRIILTDHQNYSFIKFQNAKEYYSFQQSIVLPWETSEVIKKQIIRDKAKVLKISIDSTLSLKQQEQYLDRVFYSHALNKAIEKYDEITIFNELLLLSKAKKGKSIFEDLPEPLRLEYLLALILGKKYGTQGLISNIIYNEDGLPLHCATSGKCDIIYHNEDGSYIFEPTMQRDRNAQLNSETTNIVRHVKEEEKRTGLLYRVAMIAPYVHPDIVDFFQYKHRMEKVKIMPFSIDCMMNLLKNSNDINSLNVNYDNILSKFESLDNNEFSDYINTSKCVVA